jgi:hypothetical protein
MNAPTQVIVGIIDDGIAFAHERFRQSALKTRIEFFWMQHIRLTGPGSPVLTGRQLTKAQIDNLLVQCSDAGVVDEDLVYARSGLLDFARPGHKSVGWRAAHGTHVMDLACGADASSNPDGPIVCVQLPAMVTADTSGGSLTPVVLAAIQYILWCAERIAGGRLPVVINLSYGIIAGPHDGTSNLELGIDQLIRDRKQRGLSLEVILPSGNNYLSRCHAEVPFPSFGHKVTLPWRLPPDDHTPSFVEIWMPFRQAAGPNRLKITVTSPIGESHSMQDVHGQVRKWGAPARPYAELTYSHWPNPTNRGWFLLAVQPTTVLDGTIPVAPAGIWTIEMTNLTLAPTQHVHAWIQRDDSLYGHPRRGRQSYFDDPKYQRFDHAGREIETDIGDSVVKRAGTINAIATGQSTVVVGGYQRDVRRAAKYSGSGPVTRVQGQAIMHRTGPDALVASEDSRVHSGVLAAGSRSGSVVAMSGTSMAAPQLARWAANERAHHRSADRGAVAVRAGADEIGATSPLIPNREGAGKMILEPVHKRDR